MKKCNWAYCFTYYCHFRYHQLRHVKIIKLIKQQHICKYNKSTLPTGMFSIVTHNMKTGFAL